MAIRLRVIEGVLTAICAARSVEQPGDVYLDDGAHEALARKFEADFASEGYAIPISADAVRRMEIGESNNPGREWWDHTYGATATPEVSDA